MSNESLHTVTPDFTVVDVDVLMSFLVTVFDGEVMKESRYPTGTLRHARVRIGDSVVMINEASESVSVSLSE